MKKIALLDGGMGQELIRRSAFKAHPMWSAKVLMDEPHLVEQVHKEYIDSGAQFITLNNYSATPERLERDASLDLFEPLQQRAIEVAQRARDDSKSTGAAVKIAGCLPPLYGSYHPEVAPGFEECLERYGVIATIQAEAVDLFICETMSSIKEGKAAAMAGINLGVPTWLSFSLQDNDQCLLRSGEPLADAIKQVDGLGIEAILINCSAPEAVSAAMSTLSTTSKHYGAYANGFTSINKLDVGGTVDGLNKREDLCPAAYAGFVKEWIASGATIVGGCCEVGPEHIAHLNTQIQELGYTTTTEIEDCA